MRLLRRLRRCAAPGVYQLSLICRVFLYVSARLSAIYMSRQSKHSRGKRGGGGGFSDNGWDDWGGYMNAKVQKLHEQTNDNGKVTCQSHIFKGISIFVNGYTNPSSADLKKLVVENGGHYYHYYNRKFVTHIVVSNLPNSKIAQLTGEKVVKPNWITDSVQAGRLLSYEDYALYKVRTAAQPCLSFKGQTAEPLTGPGASAILSASVDQNIAVLSDSTEKSTSQINPNDVFSKSPEYSTHSNVSHNGSAISANTPTTPGTGEFLSEFYSNSRLHHLSTWKAELSAYVNTLQSQGDEVTAEGRSKLLQLAVGKYRCGTSRVILHVDMDSFFVTVGLRAHPHLKGQPVAVTHSRGKTPSSGRNANSLQAAEDGCHSMADIASCSYEARQAGVKNGMLMGEAKTLCPQLTTIPYDFAAYKQVSQALYNVVISYTHHIEAVSCDEMLIDATSLLADTGATPEQFSELLRKEIYERTECTASVGIGPNILLAKLATRVAKPNGVFRLEPDTAAEFVLDKQISDLPGVGWSLTHKLHAMDVYTCADLQRIKLTTLQKQFGPKTGQSLYRSCRGQDDRPIKTATERKSVSAEINYGIRFTEVSDVSKFVTELSNEVQTRLKAAGAKGRAITIKVKVRQADAPRETAKFLGCGACDSYTKSSQLPVATDDGAIIADTCMALLRPLAISPCEYRGMGIQVTRLETSAGVQPPHKLQTLQKFFKNTQISDSTSNGKIVKETPCTSSTCVFSTSISKNKSLTQLARPQATSPSPLPQPPMISPPLMPRPPHISPPPLPRPPVISPPQMPRPPEMSPPFQLPQPPLISLPLTSRPPEMSPPPLPRPPELLSPPAQESGAPEWVLPSPSQVDPTVLAELPADIRHQVTAALQQKARSTDVTVDTTPVSSVMETIEQPGCSHWSSVGHVTCDEASDQVAGSSADENSRSNAEYHQGILALPSYSQIDPTCLAALPAELRSELELAYRQQRAMCQVQEPLRDCTHPLMLKLQQAKSPCKSPAKAIARSPRRGLPRGVGGRDRPKGSGRGRSRNSPKKLNFGKSTLVVNENVIKTELANETELSGSYDASDFIPPSAVNLCGAVDPHEVKMLLSDWLHSTDSPLDTDLKWVGNYFIQLTHDMQLDLVHQLFHFIYRQIKGTTSDPWRAAYASIVEQTQTAVYALHESTLKLKTFSSSK